MEATDPGLWLLPSRGRAATNLPRFFAAAEATGMTTPGAVLVNDQDYAANAEAYDALELPGNWTIYVCDSDTSCGKVERALGELCDGLKWIGGLQDDLIPETPGWDVKLLETVTGWNVVSSAYDRHPPKRMNGATIWSGDLVRAVGYINPTGFKHFFIDDIWEMLGKQMNVWVQRPDIMVYHANAALSPDRNDPTNINKNSYWANDEPLFGAWKNKEMLPAANRIGDLLIEYGVSAPLPDLADVRLLIATPSGDGRYDGLFQTALFGTIALLRQCGATVNFSEMKFCSDIALARNKMFGAFLRSDATHMMSIDADMGWNPQDIVRLLQHKRDYVAAAGPRKVFPPSFAVQNEDAYGRSAPLRQDGTGLFEVSHVGMAFCLVTKSWAQRLAAGYPDLEFIIDDGRVEYAVFNPMIIKRRYRSEDYAACERWRALGGRCYVDPYVSLQHVGTFVWQGDWISHLQQTAAEQSAAA